MAAPESTAGTTNQVSRVRYGDDDSGLDVTTLLASSLSLVLLAFVFLYIRWACRRREASSSAATASTMRPSLDADAGREASSSAATAPTMRPSLDADAINGLPVTLYNPAHSTGEKGSSGVNEQEAECLICITALVAGDKVKALPPCGHCFHPDCVDAWLRSQPSCPLCRTLLLPAGVKPVDAVD
ncbi:unnamed protein product [Alopecurus aequalis]